MRGSVLTSVAAVLLLTTIFALPTTDVRGETTDQPISITGNADLAQKAADNGWPGNGTATDPYIIEGKNITVPSDAGFVVTSTTAHLVIRGNTVTGTGAGVVYGVQAAGAHNMRIEDNTLRGTSIGVLVNAANDVVVHGNDIAASAYGIAVLAAKRTLAEGNTIDGAQHGVAVIQGEATTLRNNTVRSTLLKGIYFHNANGGLLDGNLIEDSLGTGIHIVTTPGVVARGNTVRGHDKGAVAENTAVWEGNLFEDNNEGLALRSPANVLKDNTFVDNVRGVHVQASGNTFQGNLYRGNGEGVYLIAAHDNTFTDERTENNTIGIHGFNSLRNTMTGLSTEGDATAFFLEVSRDLVMTGAHMRNHTIGIRLSGVADSTIERSDLAFNEEAIRASTGRTNVYRHNIITENENGLRLLSSTENLVYDNRFENTQNVEVTGQVTNTWSVAPQAGQNILGGPYIAGNAWHDYEGVDADGDGLGELPHGLVPYGRPAFQTLAGVLGTPYGPEDAHPLVATSSLPLPPLGG